MFASLHTRTRRALVPIAGLLALVLPAGAGAHIRLLPDEVEAGTYTVLHVNVPNESPDAAVTKVVVEFPPGFGYALYRPVAGWTGEVKTSKAAKSIIDGKVSPARVVRVTWTAHERGAEIQPQQFEEFPVAVQVPDAAGETLTFRALQTYGDGDVVRWVGGPTSRSPAPQVLVTAADAPQAAATAEDATVEEDSEDGSDGLAIAALIAGILGLLAGVAALARSVQLTRGASKTDEENEIAEIATQPEEISGTDRAP